MTTDLATIYETARLAHEANPTDENRAAKSAAWDTLDVQRAAAEADAARARIVARGY